MASANTHTPTYDIATSDPEGKLNNLYDETEVDSFYGGTGTGAATGGAGNAQYEVYQGYEIPTPTITYSANNNTTNNKGVWDPALYNVHPGTGGAHKQTLRPNESAQFNMGSESCIDGNDATK
jgi:hypothetical protein